MRVITFMNEKGGTGKTTFSTHFAAYAAREGYNVLFLDSDPQANATALFGLNEAPAFYQLCIRNADEAPFKSLMQRIHPGVFSAPNEDPQGVLIAVAGNRETRAIPLTISDPLTIRNRLVEVEDAFDFVVIDTSPTASLMHASIMLATDYVVIPTDCEVLGSFKGVPATVQAVENVRLQLNRAGLNGAELLGIIPNKFRSKTVLHNEILNVLFENYGDKVTQPFPNRIAISDTQAETQFLFGMYPNDSTTQIMERLLDELLVRIDQMERTHG